MENKEQAYMDIEKKINDLTIKCDFLSNQIQGNNERINSLSKTFEVCTDSFRNVANELASIHDLVAQAQAMINKLENRMSEVDTVKEQISTIKKAQNVLLATADFHSNQLALDSVKLAELEKKMKKVQEIEKGTIAGAKLSAMQIELNNIRNELETIHSENVGIKALIKKVRV